MVGSEKSSVYYWDGPNKKFPTQNAAQRHAEWWEKCHRKFWGEKFICSKMIKTKSSIQVEIQMEINVHRLNVAKELKK